MLRCLLVVLFFTFTGCRHPANPYDLYDYTPSQKKLLKAVLEEDVDGIMQSKDVVFYEKTSKLTPLHWAVRYSKINSIDALVKKGVSPNQPNWQGVTPTHLAMGIQCDFVTGINMFKKLVSYGGDVNKPILTEKGTANMYENDTPITISSQCSIEHLKAVVEAGANLNTLLPGSKYEKVPSGVSSLFKIRNGQDYGIAWIRIAPILKYLVVDKGADYRLAVPPSQRDSLHFLDFIDSVDSFPEGSRIRLIYEEINAYVKKKERR